MSASPAGSWHARRRTADHPHRLADGPDAGAGRRRTRPTPRTLAFWRAAGMDRGHLAERRAASGRSTSPISSRRCRWASPGSRRATRSASAAATGGVAHRRRPRAGTCDALVAGRRPGPRRRPAAAAISPNLGVYPTEPDADPVRHGWKLRPAALWPSRAHRPARPQAALHRPAAASGPDDRQPPRRVRLRHLADQPRTAAECFAPSSSAIGDAEYGLALVEAVAHIKHAAPSRPHCRSRCHKGRRHAVGGVTASPHCASTCGEHRRTR